MPRKRTARNVGNETETLACRLLIAEGYTVWRPSSPRNYKPHSGADILGLFDIVACKLGCPTRWIQVKSESAFRRKVAQAIADCPVSGVKEYWIYTGTEWKKKVIP